MADSRMMLVLGSAMCFALHFIFTKPTFHHDTAEEYELVVFNEIPQVCRQSTNGTRPPSSSPNPSSALPDDLRGQETFLPNATNEPMSSLIALASFSNLDPPLISQNADASLIPERIGVDNSTLTKNETVPSSSSTTVTPSQPPVRNQSLEPVNEETESPEGEASLESQNPTGNTSGSESSFVSSDSLDLPSREPSAN